MNYYTFFLIYLVVGVAVTAAMFYWAVSHGQFREQDRIRYAPLGKDTPVVKPKTNKWPASMILTVLVAGSGVVSLVACVILSIVLE